ncbi:MAG: pyruvate dehydrogenase (acetyl-transferring) E1 component subunit alpha [Legionellales bacterium]|nr:pyruvate dehydrogenase (acetyl-transferring) E1 component subunit alpha [Legionellales bacterium]
MTTLAEFSIDSHQLLDEHGQPTQETWPAFANDVEQLRHLYRLMMLNRLVDKKAVALQRTGKMGTYPSSFGQEAIATGIAFAMQEEDVFVPFYRDYAAMLHRGMRIEEIYSYWGGDERGSCFVNNPRDFPFSVPIASQLLHATGVATAFKLRQQPHVVVATCGDGGTSEGDFYEALNVAGTWQLPIVFVVNNNQWAISVPLSKQTQCQTLAQKAIAAGFSGVQVDGCDVIAMQMITEQAVTRARSGQGPTLIEAVCYRLCDHTTADDATRYQPSIEVEAAMAKEPIRRLRTYLTQQGAWDDQQEQALSQDIEQQITQAVDNYTHQARQPLTAMFDYLYAELPHSLIAQREQVA